ncbi:MAG: tetratricopeptide repeat protein [Bacteroidia bacterium]|nr:tetratricopeptide repeat protein [Bacteroidia bacterium]
MKKNVKKTRVTLKGKAVREPSVKQLTGNGIFRSRFRNLYFILLATAGIYFFIHNNGFVRWDDDWYIQENPQVQHFTASSTGALFTHFFKGQYSPVTTLAIALMYGKDQANPGIYHTVSALIHLLNICLVFWLILLLFESTAMSTIVAALFGLHTLQAEAVSWASAIKVLLYTLFFLAALIMYVRYVKSGKAKYFILTLVFFILSFFSKEQAVMLALCLVAIDFLLERNLKSGKLILEKLPFFALSVIMGIVTIFASKTGEFYEKTASGPFYHQIAFASYALVQYVIKLVLPVHLSAFYPYPEDHNLVPGIYWLSVIPALVIVGLFIWSLFRNRIPAFALAFFFINIILVLQIMPLRDFILADRFVYIPSIGFFIIIAWIYKHYLSQKKNLQMPLKVIFGAYLFLLFLLSYQRTGIWKDSISLFNDMVNKEPESSVAWNNRGLANYDLKNYKQAIVDFNTSIRLNPKSVFSYNNLGITYTESGDLKNAVKSLDYAISMRPEFVQAYYNRADAHSKMDNLAAAISDYDKVLTLRPGYIEAYSQRGIMKAKSGRMQDAMPDLNKAVELEPGNPEAYMNRGVVKLNLADYSGAIEDFSITIKMKPGFAYSYFNRGLAYIKSGNQSSGCNDLEKSRQMGFPQAEGALRQFCK